MNNSDPHALADDACIDLPRRHPGTTQLLGFFAYDHLPPFLQAVSSPCHDLAFDMVTTLPDGPELTAGLRKLLEAKDAFVRQALVAHQAAPGDKTPAF